MRGRALYRTIEQINVTFTPDLYPILPRPLSAYLGQRADETVSSPLLALQERSMSVEQETISNIFLRTASCKLQWLSQTQPDLLS